MFLQLIEKKEYFQFQRKQCKEIKEKTWGRKTHEQSKLQSSINVLLDAF